MQIRLLETFKYDHCEFPTGIVIDVPAGKALELIHRGVAEMAEPIKAIVEPEETRIIQRGRPRKNAFPSPRNSSDE
jgi:hypothetical protein